jgi:hypothetical protein
MAELGRIDRVDALLIDGAPPALFDALLAESGVCCVVAC